jgi:hypothetical protein
VSIFLDVDDLESIDALETYIEASQVIMLFCSKGYFQSRNCLREVRSTMEKGKRFCLMHDPEKGGATLEAVQQECPVELRGDIFDNQEVITWRRIKDFQMVSLKMLGEATLLGSPAYCNEASLPLYLPGAITTSQWAFRPSITVYCSPNNPGCERNMNVICSMLADGLAQQKRRSWVKKRGNEVESSPGKEVSQSESSELSAPVKVMRRGSSDAAAAGAAAAMATASATVSKSSDPGLRISASRKGTLGAKSSSHMILYLSSQTFVGEEGKHLASEVRDARKAGTPIVMVHQCDPDDGGCEFAQFFVNAPQDLIQDGLFKTLALALYPAPFNTVSCCLVARALGAIDLRRVNHVGGGARSAVSAARHYRQQTMSFFALPVAEAAVQGSTSSKDLQIEPAVAPRDGAVA